MTLNNLLTIFLGGNFVNFLHGAWISFQWRHEEEIANQTKKKFVNLRWKNDTKNNFFKDFFTFLIHLSLNSKKSLENKYLSCYIDRKLIRVSGGGSKKKKKNVIFRAFSMLFVIELQRESTDIVSWVMRRKIIQFL